MVTLCDEQVSGTGVQARILADRFPNLEVTMGVGVGLVLVAVGAVLTFAVNVTTHGFNVNSIGIILMIVGAVGVLIDLAVFGPRRRTVAVSNTPAATQTVVQERDTVV